MYIYTPLGRYWITLYGYVLGFIVPHVNIQLEDNKQYISNTPRNWFFEICLQTVPATFCGCFIWQYENMLKLHEKFHKIIATRKQKEVGLRDYVSRH